METYIVLIQTVHSAFYPKDGEGIFHQNDDIGPPKQTASQKIALTLEAQI